MSALRVGIRSLPQRAPGLAVDSHQLGVAGYEKEPVAQNGHPAIDFGELGLLIAPDPDPPARPGVQCVHFVAVAYIHDAFIDQGSDFEMGSLRVRMPGP